MENIKSAKTISKTMRLGILILITTLIVLICKKIGILNLVIKVFKATIPVLIAIFISFILEPIIKWFISIGIKRKISVLITYFLFFSIFILLAYFVCPILAKQIKVFIDNLPSLFSTVNNFISNIGLSIDSGSLNNIFNSIVIGLSNGILNSLESVVSILYNLILAFSGALFLSFDFFKFKESVKTKIPLILKKPVIYYFENFLPFIHKYFLGMLLDSLFIFLISVIGFSVINIDYVLILSLFIAITNLIPIIGPYIGGIPAAIIGFSISKAVGISAIIVVVIVQLIESNIIQPTILKNVISLHPLEGIFGISLFGTLFGVIGMILSPILVVAIKLLFLPYNEQAEKKYC